MVGRRSKLATICAALNDAGAAYVVVGAQAMILWGGGRATRDVDILIAATADNARKVLDALDGLGFVLTRDLDPREVATRPVTIVGDLWRVDLLTVAWSVHYREARQEARTIEVDGVPVPTASIRHLIESKRTGRVQDALDIEVLEEIRRRGGRE